MQTYSWRKRPIDWPAFRASVMASAPRAQSVPDTRPAIRTAIALLGDGHTSYRAVDSSFIFVSTRGCTSSGAVSPTDLPVDIGYVRVGGFSGTPEQATAFATGIQSTFRNADRDKVAAGDRIAPDEAIEGATAVLDRAVAWLRGAP